MAAHSIWQLPNWRGTFPVAPAQMNGGDSNVDALVYRWKEGGFVEHQRLCVAGGEDVEFFKIADRAFLATASLLTGADPYALKAHSMLFEFGQWTIRTLPELSHLCRQTVEALRDRQTALSCTGAGCRHRLRDRHPSLAVLHFRVGWIALPAVSEYSVAVGLQLGIFLRWE